MKKIIAIVLIAGIGISSIAGLNSCITVMPEPAPEPTPTPTPTPAPALPPATSTEPVSPPLLPELNPTPAPMPAPAPSKQVLVEDSFHLGTYDAEKMETFYDEHPEWRDTPYYQWPQSILNENGFYYSELFFLKEGEEFDIFLRADCPVSLNNADCHFGSGLSLEIQWIENQWDWENLPIKWCEIKRLSGNNWEIKAIVVPQLTGFHFLEFENESGNNVFCHYTTYLSENED